MNPSIPTVLVLLCALATFALGGSLSAPWALTLALLFWRVDVLSSTVAILAARLDAIRGQGGGGT